MTKSSILSSIVHFQSHYLSVYPLLFVDVDMKKTKTRLIQ